MNKEKEKATKKSWDNEPMIETRLLLPYTKSFTQEEYELLSYGVIPDSMDEKWFIYFEDNVIYFHRSWTGICIFQVFLERNGDGYQIKEAWAEYDKEYFDNEEDFSLEELIREDVEMLDYLVDVFLLDKPDRPLSI